MKKIFIVVALIALSFSALGGCGGGGAGGPSMPPGENSGVASVVQLLPSTFIAQTNSSITLNTKVLDGNGIPVVNISVYFTNLSHPFGTLSSTVANTNAYGIASVTLYSTTPGFATILAQVNTGAGQVRDRKSVYFSTKDVLAVTMSLDVESVPANETPVVYNDIHDITLFENDTDDTVSVIATVFDAGGVPVGGGMPVDWSASHTEAKFIFKEIQTDVNGQAKAVVQVTPSSIRNTETHINAMAYAFNGAANMVTLLLQPVVVDASKSSLSAKPTIVNTGGTSELTAVVMLNTGHWAPDGTVVNFTTTCGTVTPFAQTTSGVATGTFTAPATPGTCTVTAKAGGVTIGSVAITVTTTLTVLPSTVSIDGTAGGTATFTIFGGVAPYTVISNSTTILPVPPTVTASPWQFTVTVPAGTPAGSITLTVRDAKGTTATVTITITAGAALSVVPASGTVVGVNNPAPGNCPPDGDASDDLIFLISGGTPPYAVISNNLVVIPACAMTIVGGTLTVDPDNVAASTNVTITITDSSVPVQTKTVTVTVN